MPPLRAHQHLAVAGRASRRRGLASRGDLEALANVGFELGARGEEPAVALRDAPRDARHAGAHVSRVH